MKYAYITNKTFSNGEIVVEGRAADGTLLFGFRTRDYFGWRNKAREYTPASRIPVFQANRPAEVRA